jgi:hypothetical protein
MMKLYRRDLFEIREYRLTAHVIALDERIQRPEVGQVHIRCVIGLAHDAAPEKRGGESRHDGDAEEPRPSEQCR